jgi:hypothetical protein
LFHYDLPFPNDSALFLDALFQMINYYYPVEEIAIVMPAVAALCSDRNALILLLFIGPGIVATLRCRIVSMVS